MRFTFLLFEWADGVPCHPNEAEKVGALRHDIATEWRGICKQRATLSASAVTFVERAISLAGSTAPLRFHATLFVNPEAQWRCLKKS
jgi:hypothetical protein